MARPKHMLRIALILFCCLAVAGCWDRHEIESMAFVTIAGVDLTKQQRIDLSVHIAKPFAIVAGQSNSRMQERTYWLVSETGVTAIEAAEELQNQSARTINWSHARIMIWGEDYARHGVFESVDLLQRRTPIRMRNVLLVAKGAPASELLQTEFELERQPTEGLLGILESAGKNTAVTCKTTALEFNRDLVSEGIEPVVGAVELVPRPNRTDPRGQLLDNSIPVSARIAGAAVFKQDRLVGWLDESQTRGLNYLKNKVKGCFLTIPNPRHEQKKISVERLNGETYIIPQFVNGKPIIRVLVKASADIAESNGSLNTLDEQLIKQIETGISASVNRDIRAALFAAQTRYNTDVVGFGLAFSRSYPREWRAMKQDWDQIFPLLEVKVEVKTDLRRTGQIVDSIHGN
ncbi:MAG: Ger(x)C family spore germination protein [Solirubrobacterales bacterium]